MYAYIGFSIISLEMYGLRAFFTTHLHYMFFKTSIMFISFFVVVVVVVVDVVFSIYIISLLGP